MELDALQEAINIGVGHAATALSQLTNQTIHVSVPRINLAPLDETPELLGISHKPIVAASMELLGEVTGKIWLAMPRSDAKLLCTLLLGRDPGAGDGFDPMEESSFKEATNILGSAYLNAVGQLIGVVMLPSVPSFTLDISDVVFSNDDVSPESRVDRALCAEAAFAFEKFPETIRGYVLLLPTLNSIDKILEGLRANLGRRL